MCNKIIVVFVAILLAFLATPAVAEETPTLLEILEALDDPSKRYPEFKKIKYFGDVEVKFVNGGEQDAKNIGLGEKELTDYLRLKFKNNFAKELGSDHGERLTIKDLCQK